MEKKLYRSKQDRMVFGVCGGLAEYFGIDSTLVRIFFALLLFTGAWVVILYLILALVIPENPEQKQVKKPISSKNNYLIIGLGLVTIGTILLLNSYNIINWGRSWPILIIILGGFIIWQNQKEKKSSKKKK